MTTTFETVRGALDEPTIDALCEFWVAQKALPSAEVARQRAPQAVAVARDGGAIVGVSTAYAQHNAQLHHRFWYVRLFVAEPRRRQRVAWDLWVHVRDVLEAAFVSGEDTDCIGIVLEVESPALKQIDRAVWRTGPVFFGKNARGAHLRVYYFEGARIR